MSSPPLYGLDRELKEKAKGKYNVQREKEAIQWIEAVTKERLKFPDDFQASLKDGVLLCKCLNEIRPNFVKFSVSAMPFKQMENISAFLAGAEKLGCPKHDLFQTVDLFENKNLGAVVDAIFSLSRHAQKHGYNGPAIGPKLADRHEVSFSDEQLNAGKAIPSQQSGYNKGANASGISYGARREVFDPKAKVHQPLSNETPILTASANKGANQSTMGVGFANRRQIHDDKSDIHKPVDSTPTQQVGAVTGANQSSMGVSFASKRQIT